MIVRTLANKGQGVLLYSFHNCISYVRMEERVFVSMNTDNFIDNILSKVHSFFILM